MSLLEPVELLESPGKPRSPQVRKAPTRTESAAGGEDPAAPRSFARGALEALWITALFAALGLGYAEIVKRAASEAPVYASGCVAARAPEGPSVWLVDGFNVVQRALLGGRERDEWWTARHRTELLERAARFDDAAAEVWVVFDGADPEPQEAVAARLRSVFAPSADAWLVAKIRAAEDPGRIAVVTADRRLAARARRRGAQVVSPSEFLRRCSG